ncbi:hypothetical protein BDR03DRAFT_980945 [Suillus americanus]|nr:hypothetical protein BDR03DRAFT_980945 [Suillus americanus]
MPEDQGTITSFAPMEVWVTSEISSLLNNGVPFAFILYADKMHLTLSGHVKAYPVIAHCANLPVHIRNNDGIGGGRVVGWLPIVPTDSNKDGKLSYTNLKCVVWHKVFKKLLESIILYSKTDYEEQYNALWEVDNSDPHKTLSCDPLHVNDIGNWGNHLFGELKAHVKALGHEAEAKINKQFDAFPRWRDLNHFKSIMQISFSDGNKLRDIAKQMLYAAQNVLRRSEDPVGYALLQCIALNVHTEATLAAGEAELRAYIDTHGEDLTKNWNFLRCML